MLFRLTNKVILILSVFCFSGLAQNNKNTVDELILQAKSLLQEQDYDKAKLTLKLYQKYVEKDPLKWLNAQLLLIRSEIELNNFRESASLIKAAQKVIADNQLKQMSVSFDLEILNAEILEVKNMFAEAEHIYRHILKQQDLLDVRIKLANNLIDRVLTGYSSKPKDDYEELREIISHYEKEQARNPLELIRIKQKVDSYRMINEETLKNLEKLSNYWIQKDEYTLFRIYLNNMLRKYKDSYDIWLQNHELLSLKTHPLTVPTLVNLSRHYTSTDLQKSQQINKTLTVLIRDERDRSLVTSVVVNQLIAENKTADALAYYRQFIKNHDRAPDKAAMLISLSEAFMEARDYKNSEQLLTEVSNLQISDPELKSRKVYIEASLLQAAGKNNDAAVLFLRVGQTATDSETALKSLFMAGRSFYGAKQCNRAVIAFKMLLEKPRNKYSDEAMYYLSLSHAQCKEYKEAINIIDQIVIVGKEPEYKRKALFEKGEYYFKDGNIEKAIEAYNDYTVVYSTDSRNASVWFKIYKIHRSQKSFDKGDEMLSKIIKSSSQNSPEIYSRALHQKALLYQLKGETRKSISLWQTFLEFNQKVETSNKDEVKLMLAAAYQNSETLNLTAAQSIYLEIIETTKDEKIREIATFNLLTIIGNSPELLTEYLSKIFKFSASFSEETTDLLLEKILAPSTFSTLKMERSVALFIPTLKNEDQKLYWTGRYEITGNKSVTPEKAAALLENIKSEKYRYKKMLILRDLHLAGKNPDRALTDCLEIIYLFTSKVSQNDYFDWRELAKSAVTAAAILKKSGKTIQALKIKERIAASKIPEAAAIASQIDKVLQGGG